MSNPAAIKKSKSVIMSLKATLITDSISIVCCNSALCAVFCSRYLRIGGLKQKRQTLDTEDMGWIKWQGDTGCLKLDRSLGEEKTEAVCPWLRRDLKGPWLRRYFKVILKPNTSQASCDNTILGFSFEFATWSDHFTLPKVQQGIKNHLYWTILNCINIWWHAVLWALQ